MTAGKQDEAVRQALRERRDRLGLSPVARAQAEDQEEPAPLHGNGDLAVDPRGASRRAADDQRRNRRDPRLRTGGILILDSSAIVAIIEEEDDPLSCLAAARRRRPTSAIGAPTLFESAIVFVAARGSLVGCRPRCASWRRTRSPRSPSASSTGPSPPRPSSATARAATRRRLNYGDCMTYATAKIADAPLLFVGDDFAQTDLKLASGDRAAGHATQPTAVNRAQQRRLGRRDRARPDRASAAAPARRACE